MTTLERSYANWAPYLLSVARVVAAALFMEHGTQKLFSFPAGPPSGPIELMSVAGLAGGLEFFGGFLLLIGLFTRPVALVLSGEMAVAYFLMHAPEGFWPLLNKGELAVLYCFLFLYISSAGGGAWSIDRMWLERGEGMVQAPTERWRAA